MKKIITNIQASIRSRLQNKAKESNRPFAEVLQYYGIERFLYRFSCSQYSDKFILKGALLFGVWDIPERRTTLDIDLMARYDNQVSSIEKVIKEICNVTVEPDGLIFVEKTVQGRKIKEDADYEGVRVKFIGLLDNTQIPMQIDIGFGDVIYPRTKSIKYPVILDLPQPHLKGYPVESVISEKLEAIIKLGSLNSRMKDFYDIWLLMRQYNFNGSFLVGAIKRTFKHRKTDIPVGSPIFADDIYNESSDRQALWKAFVKKRDINHIPDKLTLVAEDIEKFLSKPLVAIHNNQEFNEKWLAHGSWK